jgi:hypothetical protein
MKVYVANGYYDLATRLARYTFNTWIWVNRLQDNLRMVILKQGMMMYITYLPHQAKR